MPSRARNLKQAEETNSLARRIVAQTTEPTDADQLRQLRSQAASILSKLGASKGGKARAKKLTATERSDIAKRAAESRWKAKR